MENAICRDYGGGGNRTRVEGTAEVAAEQEKHEPRVAVLAVESMEPRSDGWLYFVQQGIDGPVKIGRAKNVRARLADLQVANPLPLRVICACPGSAGEERWVHQQLKTARMSGEWFEIEAVFAFLHRWLGIGPQLLALGVVPERARLRAAKRLVDWTAA